MEHLSNCHGEMTFLLVLLSQLPFVGMWFRSRSTIQQQGRQQ